MSFTVIFATIGIMMIPALFQGKAPTSQANLSASNLPSVAQSVNWSKIPIGDSHPNLWDPVMAYDKADGYVLLYGATPFCCGFPYATQTWIFHAGIWKRLNVSADPGVERASMAYDARDGYVLLFGGVQLNCAVNICEVNNTWKFHAGNWTNISSAVAPFPRADASMVYDTSDRYVLIFGGEWGSTSVSGTWEFHGGKWHQLTPATSPSLRRGAAMVFDPVNGYVVLFGGMAFCCQYLQNDTWKFAGGKWTNISSSPSPSGRSEAAVTFDPKLGCDVLFGGIVESGLATYSTANDTWTFVNGGWTNVTPTHSPPDHPYGNGPLVYDGANGYAIMVVPKLDHGLMTWKIT
ncbi:MAG: hypothetical protein L3K23_02215 [Thermoplasmata archaeon]|nr:hypothetical protein [Thermoplasmata archaeon]